MEITRMALLAAVPGLTETAMLAGGIGLFSIMTPGTEACGLIGAVQTLPCERGRVEMRKATWCRF